MSKRARTGRERSEREKSEGRAKYPSYYARRQYKGEPDWRQDTVATDEFGTRYAIIGSQFQVPAPPSGKTKHIASQTQVIHIKLKSDDSWTRYLRWAKRGQIRIHETIPPNVKKAARIAGFDKLEPSSRLIRIQKVSVDRPTARVGYIQCGGTYRAKGKWELLLRLWKARHWALQTQAISPSSDDKRAKRGMGTHTVPSAKKLAAISSPKTLALVKDPNK